MCQGAAVLRNVTGLQMLEGDSVFTHLPGEHDIKGIDSNHSKNAKEL